MTSNRRIYGHRVHSQLTDFLRAGFQEAQSIRDAFHLFQARICRDSGWPPRSSVGLLDLLIAHRHPQCLLAHDKFFELLGLANDAKEYVQFIDYDAPLKKVVLNFAVTGKIAELLRYAGAKSLPSKFPSWCADWTKSVEVLPLSGDFWFSAAHKSELEVTLGEDQSVLRVKGYIMTIKWPGQESFKQRMDDRG